LGPAPERLVVTAKLATPATKHGHRRTVCLGPDKHRYNRSVKSSDVIVLGCGVIGASLARELNKSGAQCSGPSSEVSPDVKPRMPPQECWRRMAAIFRVN